MSEKPNFDNYRLTNGVKTNVSQVSWKQLSDWKAQDQTTLVFIGRDNCEYCQEFKKILDPATYKTGVNVVYYNTLPDREKEWFTDAMAKYGVTQVPTLLSVGYGKVKNFQHTELDPIMTSSDKLEKFLTDSDKWKIQ